MIKIDKKKFETLEEIIAYFFSISFFLDFDIAKIFPGVMLGIIILRYILFKEKLDCGNEKIKKFFLFFLIFGLIWNFLGSMNYRPSRNYLKIMRWIVLPFYFYPILIEKKEILNRVLSFGAFSFMILFIKSGIQYSNLNPWERVSGINGIDITGFSGMYVSNFALGFVLYEEKIWKKIVFSFLYCMGVLLIIFTQMRSALIGLIIGNILILFSHLKLKTILIVISFTVSIFLFSLKENITELSRFKTTFNTEKNISNESNLIRIELWKNAIWRIKQHPVLGSGTNYDKKLFDEYSLNMPENTETEKYIKSRIIEDKYNDSHNMYLNGVSDNGIFFLCHLILWFGIIPYLILKNKIIENKFFKNLNSIILGNMGSYYFIGLTWAIWRGIWSPMFFWMNIVLLLFLYSKENKK